MKKVTKAVIPAAGFGTRFLPWTKAMPKEMLPIVNKPVLQHIVEELVEAGIKDIIIVTGYHKRGVEDHFDNPNEELVSTLKAGGEKKKHLLEEVEQISSLANFYYVRQKGPKGNITPLMNAAPIIGDEPFIYTWADDFFETDNAPSMTKQLIESYNKHNASILSCIRATNDDAYNQNAFAKGKELSDGSLEVSEIIEKPGKANAPSDLGAVSGYLFTPDALNYFAEAKAIKEKYKDTEFIYTHLLEAMIADKKKVIAKEIKGKYINTGEPLDYLEMQVMYGAKDKKIGESFKKYLKDFTANLD
jgi:UTP--glucose-1-phosphate uridylyltransferase